MVSYPEDWPLCDNCGHIFGGVACLNCDWPGVHYLGDAEVLEVCPHPPMCDNLDCPPTHYEVVVPC